MANLLSPRPSLSKQVAKMTDQTLANYIDSLRSIRKERSFSILWQDKKVWVKQQEHPAPKWLQLASHAIAALSSNPLYFPSAESGAPLEREAVRLKLMHVKASGCQKYC